MSSLRDLMFAGGPIELQSYCHRPVVITNSDILEDLLKGLRKPSSSNGSLTGGKDPLLSLEM